MGLPAEPFLSSVAFRSVCSSCSLKVRLPSQKPRQNPPTPGGGLLGSWVEQPSPLLSPSCLALLDQDALQEACPHPGLRPGLRDAAGLSGSQGAPSPQAGDFPVGGASFLSSRSVSCSAVQNGQISSKGAPRPRPFPLWSSWAAASDSIPRQVERSTSRTPSQSSQLKGNSGGCGPSTGLRKVLAGRGPQLSAVGGLNHVQIGLQTKALTNHSFNVASAVDLSPSPFHSWIRDYLA